MPLSAALAMSGLTEEQLGSELRGIIRPGAILLQPVQTQELITNTQFDELEMSPTDGSGDDNQNEAAAPLFPNSPARSAGAAARPVGAAARPSGAPTRPAGAAGPSGAPEGAAAISPPPDAQNFLQFVSDMEEVQLEPVDPTICGPHRPNLPTPEPRKTIASKIPETKTPNVIKRNILDLGSNIRPFNEGFQQARAPFGLFSSPSGNWPNLPDAIDTCPDCNFEFPQYNK